MRSGILRPLHAFFVSHCSPGAPLLSTVQFMCIGLALLMQFQFIVISPDTGRPSRGVYMLCFVFRDFCVLCGVPAVTQPDTLYNIRHGDSLIRIEAPFL